MIARWISLVPSDDHERGVAEVAFGVEFGGVAIAAVYAEPR
jgi:hypothetical protein